MGDSKETGPDAGPSQPGRDRDRERSLIERQIASLDQSPDSRLEDLDVSRKRVEIDGLEDLRSLRKQYAKQFFWMLAAQLMALNLIFILAGCGMLSFSGYTLQTFILGTLVQIVSVILVIAKHLFPTPNKSGE